MAKRTTIRCPHCGYEYLPAEIYYPQDFLGNPSGIIKDDDGSIIAFDGDDMSTEEHYVCDHCGKEFRVEAVITFKTEKIANIFDDGDDFDIDK